MDVGGSGNDASTTPSFLNTWWKKLELRLQKVLKGKEVGSTSSTTTSPAEVKNW